MGFKGSGVIIPHLKQLTSQDKRDSILNYASLNRYQGKPTDAIIDRDVEKETSFKPIHGVDQRVVFDTEPIKTLEKKLITYSQDVESKDEWDSYHTGLSLPNNLTSFNERNK